MTLTIVRRVWALTMSAALLVALLSAPALARVEEKISGDYRSLSGLDWDGGQYTYVTAYDDNGDIRVYASGYDSGGQFFYCRAEEADILKISPGRGRLVAELSAFVYYYPCPSPLAVDLTWNATTEPSTYSYDYWYPTEGCGKPGPMGTWHYVGRNVRTAPAAVSGTVGGEEFEGGGYYPELYNAIRIGTQKATFCVE